MARRALPAVLALRGPAGAAHPLRTGKLDDPRAADALDILLGLQRDDGCWHKGPSWWRKPGSPGSNVEVVDWGGRGPSEMTTLNALRILRAAGLLGV